MAGGKETPRQKMIGMMYLVLTALLALNISKDILNAFIQIDKGLGQTNEVLKGKADATLGGLRNAKEADKAAPFLAKAEEVHNIGTAMIEHMEVMKARIIACSMHGDREGKHWEEYYDATTKKSIDLSTEVGREKVSKLDENQNNTTMLVGPNPQTPRTDPWSANELKVKLETFRDELKKIQVTNVDGKVISLDQDIINSLDSAFTFTKEYEDAEGNPEVWETNKFYHSPLAAVIATMSKMETDVMNAQTSVMSFLASSINATDLKFSDVTVAAVPKQSYVLKGDEYELEIYLAAYNKNSNTKVYMGGAYNSDQMPTPTSFTPSGEGIATEADGKAHFKTNTGSLSLGPHGYTGMIAYEKDGKQEFIPFATQPFFVGEAALVVSPVNMNVFYRGLDNPVEISVPGVDPSALKVSMDGGSIGPADGKGIRNVKPGEGKEATIRVTATINGKDTQMPPKQFRIKRIPDPVPSFSGKKPYDSTVSQGDAGVAAGIRAEMEGFDFPVTATVKSFKITIQSGGTLKEYASEGNRMPEAASKAIKAAKKSEKIFLEEIMCDMPDGTKRKLSPITLKLI